MWILLGQGGSIKEYVYFSIGIFLIPPDKQVFIVG